MTDEDLKQRQEDELEAIKAIYLSDVTDFISGPGGNWHVTIRLFPQRGSSGGGKQQFAPMSVLLSISIPANYPNVAPEIQLSDSKGLSLQEVDELKIKLTSVAESNVGEVMILSLAQTAEEYLYEHRKLPRGSFYDEMLLLKKQQREEFILKKQEVEEKQRLAAQEEIQKRREALEEEIRKQREEWKSHQISENLSKSPTTNMLLQGSPPARGDELVPPSFGGQKNRRSMSLSISSRRRRSTSEGSDSSFSGTSDIVNMEFSCGKTSRKFQRAGLLGKSDKGCKVYAGIDCSNGSLVAISEWCFEFASGKKGKRGSDAGQNVSALDAVLKQFHVFEQEFNLLQKLESSNIVLYWGMRFVNNDSTNLYLYIAQEFIRGSTLRPYLQGNISLDVALVKHCAIGILKALDYLHSNNVVHRFLRDTSVFIDASGEIKVGDYGLERKICELYFAHNGVGSEGIVDKFSPSIGRGAKKTDIYRFGVLILSLLKGEYESQNPPQIPPTLPEELKDFLRKCLTTNEQQRWTASQLMDHGFLKMYLQSGLTCRNFRNGGSVEDSDEQVSQVNGSEPQVFYLANSKGISRLQNEFQVLQWLGKGGFGDVMKVKNKLDGGIYALKRIRLNPRNKQLNKKITREVKLLSQLNHENVVRYFNSWIETVVDCLSEESSTVYTASTPANHGTADLMTPKSVRFNLPDVIAQKNSIGLVDNVEDLAPPMKDTDWSFSAAGEDDNYETEESSEDEDIFGTSFIRSGFDDSGDDIVFDVDVSSGINSGSESADLESAQDSRQHTYKVANVVPVSGNNTERTSTAEPGERIMTEIQFMYIQMEFCEKSTLRTAIDDGLHQDMDRGWRLFREIVEGLVHIHQQGMIHRDLKPVNIFLDSNDHVKIGDFGLATTNMLQPKNSADVTLFDPAKPGLQQSLDFGEESMTGQVGTALYVAPELVTPVGAKVLYNQKVDIYSLGIILFEMFYRPMETGMERVRTILNLRQRQVMFPSDFDEMVFPQVAYIAKWLLNHEPSQRPTSLELLQSDYMPPPLMEETALHDMFRHTLSKPKSKAYKFLIASCFLQNVSPADDITYNYGLEKRGPNPNEEIIHHALLQKVKKIAQTIFERHGAVEMNTSLLMPKTELNEPHKSAVQLMTHCGNIVTIPYDLRIPFVKHAVRNRITNIKRFCIAKVFREKKVYGLHPTELYECALDIISSSKGTLISDVEVLAITFEVFGDLPWIRDKSFTLRLSHTNLLDAVLLHFSVDSEKCIEIKSILASVKLDKTSKSQVHTRLVSLCLPDQFMSILFNLMETEGALEKISEHNVFKSILKKKGVASSKVNEAFHELEILIGNIESFGLKCEVVITPTLVFSTSMYSGLLWQVVCNLRRHKSHQIVDVIAVGGRYDALIDKLRSTLEMYGLASKDVAQFGVGISISLDKLVTGLDAEDLDKYGAVKSVEVLICSLGHHPMSKEKINLMKDLVSHGIQCTILDESESIESVEEHCRQLGAQFIVILKESEDMRVRTWEKDRFQEKRLSKAELIEHIERNRKVGGSHDESFGHSSLTRVDSVNFGRGQSESSSNLSSQLTFASNLRSVNISFFHNETNKINLMKRRQHQIMSHVESVLSKLSKQQLVELIVTDLSFPVINTLACVQIHDKAEFNKSVLEVIDKHPRIKHLQNICDEIFYLYFEKSKVATVIILYSFYDNYYRVLM